MIVVELDAKVWFSSRECATVEKRRKMRTTIVAWNKVKTVSSLLIIERLNQRE